MIHGQRLITATALTGLVLALGACGSRKDLRATPGMDPVPVAVGAEEAATPEELIEPSPQARPDRSAEQLKRSEERVEDPFALPPS